MIKRAIIVGAGAGGLSAAVDLASAGWKVDVFESNGEPGKIHLSQRTFDLLDKNSSFNVRSQSISMKGKGVMQTILIGQAVRQ